MAIDISRFISRFLEEARDHLRRLGEGLAALEAGSSPGSGDDGAVNAIFRSAHTIKGSSRMLKLVPITEIAHRLEDVLGPLRDGRLRFDPELGRLLFRAVDALSAQVDALDRSRDPAALPAPDSALIAALAVAAQGTAVQGNTARENAVRENAVREKGAAPEPAPPPQSAPARPAETVRVRLAKLDELIKLQGEVVSSHARMRERLHDIQALVRALPEAPAGNGGAEAHAQGLRHFARALRDDVLAQELLMSELHDRTLILRMLPLATIFENAGRMVRDLARSVGKDAVCEVSGAEIELDRQVIDQLADPIVHLLRNAVDHGLEAPQVRAAAGKPVRGRITLAARQDGGRVLITVADDGGGIPLRAVRDKAVRRGLLGEEQAEALSDAAAVDLIFRPGFSTSALITDLSGRGVGLDVVKQCVVDELQGAVSVDTRPGAGTRFTLRLPLSLAVMRILLVGVDGVPFAFAAQHIAELVRVPADSLLTVAGRAMAVIRNEFVPVARLSALLDLPARLRRPAPVPGGSAMLQLVIVRVRSEKLALTVDTLLDERDMVMKPLPGHLRRFPLVSAVVTTGRNELVSVLHGAALLELARRSQPGAREIRAEAAARVLVVDDSLNTREIEKDVLEACGYRVTLAEDGRDGLAKALAEPFDAVITDIEMPHLDGFAFTARLRQEETYRSRPIIIVTSREKEDDKRRGVEVGANAYIVKGEFGQSLLVDTLKSLLG